MRIVPERIRYCDSQALAVSMAGRAAGIPV